MKELDDLMESFSEELQNVAIENRFPYIFTKASMVLKVGAEEYAENDFFDHPYIRNAKDVSAIEDGCRQICAGKGLTKELPLSGIGVSGFASLMRLLHFDKVERSTSYGSLYNDSNGALDKITFQHVVDRGQCTYYNFCIS